MRKLIVIGCVLVLAGIPVSAHAGKWSDYVTVSTEGDVVVSYRQREQKDGWFIEWKVENNGADWVEPFAKSRTYGCEDGSQTTLDKKTLGPRQATNVKDRYEIAGFVQAVKSAR